MKRIEALIRPEKLHEVAEALIAAGVDDFTAAKVHGVGLHERQRVCYRGVEYMVDLVPRTRLDVVVSDALCSDVVEAILTKARTGAAGDGMIFVHNYADAIPVWLDDMPGAEVSGLADDVSASSPRDDHADLPEEPVLSHRRMGAAAIVTGVIKLLGLAGARWHDLIR
jgi:nitrogen regulatory protein PII